MRKPYSFFLYPILSPEHRADKTLMSVLVCRYSRCYFPGRILQQATYEPGANIISSLFFTKRVK